MNNKLLVPILLLVIAALAAILLLRSPKPQPAPAKPTRTQTTPSHRPTPQATPADTTSPAADIQPLIPADTTAAAIAAANPYAGTPIKTDPAEAQEAIQEQVVTYEAASLPKIAPYLYSPNPEIRESALQGMLQMGEAAASPLLRKAADHALANHRPREAQELLDAADFLELPPATLLRKNKTQQPQQ